MRYEMNLNPLPFKVMKKGLKTIEMRLKDERRKGIKAGDEIVFTQTETKEQLLVEIIDVYPYKDFKELYKSFDKTELGYEIDEPFSYEDMYEYYSKELIEKYGVLAIRIKQKRTA